MLTPKGIDHFHSRTLLEDWEDCSFVDWNSHWSEPMVQHREYVHIHHDRKGKADFALPASVDLAVFLVSD